MKRQLLRKIVIFFLVSLSIFNLKAGPVSFSKKTAKSVSNSWITSFAEDKNGYMWIGTYYGLNRYNGYDFKQYYYDQSDSTSLSFSYIFALFCDSKGILWVSVGNGLCRYTEDDTFERYTIPGKYPIITSFFETPKGEIIGYTSSSLLKFNSESNDVEKIVDSLYYSGGAVMDAKSNIWVFFPDRGICYDSDGTVLHDITIDSGRDIRSPILDKNGTIILCTNKGLLKLNPETLTVEEFAPLLKKHPILSKVNPYRIHRHGKMYMLFTYEAGAYLFNPYDGAILHQSDNKFPFDMSDMIVTCTFSDSNNNLWVGSKGKGFVVDYTIRKRFNKGRFLWKALEGKNTPVVLTRGDIIYIGAKNRDFYSFNTKTAIIEKMDLTMPDRPFVSLDYMTVGADGTFYIVGDMRLLKYHREGNKMVFDRDLLSPAPIMSVLEDKFGTLWASGYGPYVWYLEQGESEFKGIQVNFPPGFNYSIDLRELSSGDIAVLSFDDNISLIAPVNKNIVDIIRIKDIAANGMFIPTQMMEGSDGKLWIGTTNQGIYRYSFETKQFDHIEVSDGLACNSVTSMIEDAKGDVWVSTLSGLSKYNRTTGRFNSWYEEDGTGGNEYVERASTLTTNNLLMFGRSNGITFLDPNAISYTRTYNIQIENFHIRSGKRKDSHLLLNDTPEIVLKHNENNITISYAAIYFSDNSSLRYSYKMEGLDQEWINAGFGRQASYSELPAGKYVFRVKINNPDDDMNTSEASINITVRKSPWASTLAIIIYSLLGALIIFLLLRIYTSRVKELEELEQVKREKEQEKKTGEANMEFFTNISHEFRTPLTMISGPVAQLQGKEGQDQESKYLLAIIQRSVNRMLLLIDQILDFRKIESGVMTLQVQKYDIIKELTNIVEVFALNAKEKGISMTKHGLLDSYITWLDVDRINKIMSNIISNALKFTPSGGEISIGLEIIDRDQCKKLFPDENVKSIESPYVLVTVGDTGPGFSEESMKQAFTKYFIQDNKRHYKNWSSGIGLYYTYKLLTYHHGFIKAENKATGGALVSFAIPAADIFYSKDERNAGDAKADLLMADRLKELKESSPIIVNGPEDIDNKPTVLVIDDDSEICYYLKMLISKQYNVIVRFSADVALADMEKIYPSIIISDVLMPGMDGYEFCKAIKNDDSYSHIPVILLTAKAAIDNQIEGLQIGADAYVTKPFDPEYLMAMIGSQLTNRGKLQTFLKEHTNTEDVELTALSVIDKQFMDALYKIMEDELSNPEINITQISQDMHLSRTKLYYKIKGLTGDNPNNFFRCYKLNRAAEMLKTGNHNISEVADMTGFKSVSHFSTVFKKQFGVAPTKWEG